MNYMRNDVIELTSGEVYVIVDIIDRFNERYYYIVSVNDEETSVSTTCKIVKIINNGEKDYIKTVDDKNELGKAISLFLSRYA